MDSTESYNVMKKEMSNSTNDVETKKEVATSNDWNNAPIEGSSKGNNGSVHDTNVEGAKNNKNVESTEEEIQVELPQGISLRFVSGINIPYEEAGNVLQFLEFCSTFGNTLCLRKGQALTVLRELLSNKRNKKREEYSSLIALMIQLLNLISNDRKMSLSLSATNNNWFTAIGDCLLQSKLLSDDFPPESFKGGVSEYEKMDASKKLKLLNFLCDESLSTRAMRNYIKTQQEENEAKIKEVKQKAKDAKEKEKQLRGIMQSDLPKAYMEIYGVPLPIEEHHAIISRLGTKVQEAHDEMLEAKEMASRKRQRCDAVRTDPIILNDNGQVLWRLKCFEEEPNFLLQDLGTFDDICPHEKWLTFKPEQKEVIEKLISSKRN